MGSLQFGSAAGSGEASTLLSLKAYEEYNTGRPKLDGFILHVYDDEEKMVSAYKKRSIEGIAGLKRLPDVLDNDSSLYTYRFNATAATMVFFKTSEGALSDGAVRRALVLATDKQSIKSALSDDLRLVHQPFLVAQTGYAKEYNQPAYNPAAANTILEQAGWVNGKDGIRVKSNQPLSIIVVAEETPENQQILRKLKEQWRGVGVDVQAALQQSTDFQSSVEAHAFSALLYTVSIGPDPDVYAYWSSTQADPRSSNRLNFSEYKSAVADSALEGGRTRQDPVVRALKYKAFLKAWQDDAPAVGLFQPKILYLSRGVVQGLNEHSINTDADRYYSVTNWAVKQGQIPK
ncbi:hypothetical protein IPL68_06870 [Candidatus Saccharibacteria bacterium]|nr:MAG: hypothetical protein IPL68_06870 [Candidatus Saccharibacteria bacterium]